MKKLVLVMALIMCGTSIAGALEVVVLFENGDPIVNAEFIEESGEYVLTPASYIQLDTDKIGLVEYSYEALDTDNFIWYQVAGSSASGNDFPDGRFHFPNDIIRVREVSLVGHKKVPIGDTSVSTVKSRY